MGESARYQPRRVGSYEEQDPRMIETRKQNPPEKMDPTRYDERLGGQEEPELEEQPKEDPYEACEGVKKAKNEKENQGDAEHLDDADCDKTWHNVRIAGICCSELPTRDGADGQTKSQEMGCPRKRESVEANDDDWDDAEKDEDADDAEGKKHQKVDELRIKLRAALLQRFGHPIDLLGPSHGPNQRGFAVEGT
jgi:hypothetical protein